MSQRRIPESWTPFQEAAYLTVREFRRGDRAGANALGPLLGKSPRVLDNEVNPEVTTHKLGAEDSILIQTVAADCRMLYAASRELSHASIPLADLSGTSDTELLNAYANLHKEIGETAAAINKALDDSRITRAEFRRIDQEIHEDIQAALALRNRLEALIDD